MATDKKSLLTEEHSDSNGHLTPAGRQLITDAIADSKRTREQAISNAHNALVDAFGPRLNDALSRKFSEEGLPEKELNNAITELEEVSELIRILENTSSEEDDDMVKECRRRLDEAKDPSVPVTEKERMYRDIHRKFWSYVQSLPNRDFSKASTPRKLTESEQAEKKFRENKTGTIRWISYEGSMIVCALISVSDSERAFVNMSQLPKEDQEIILSMTDEKAKHGFHAGLDTYKNFDCNITKTDGTDFHFTLGNRVASIPPHESSRFGTNDIKVERKGNDILIGDRIKLERQRIQDIVKPDPQPNTQPRTGFQPRTKVAGRNAYEIRADILEMALDWAKSTGDKKLDTDDVLDIADAFYGFVEHK